MKHLQVFPSQDFMRCLKIPIELADFKDDGRRFQVKLPLKVKEFMPNFCDLVEGNIRFIPLSLSKRRSREVSVKSL